ncbi:hypothetical protein Ancab_029767 [Ancistrocladus abbreviatus]
MSHFLKLFLSFILIISLLSHSTIGFNITKLLDQHSDFSTFNEYLTQTQLASNINNRKTITILVVDNSNMGSLSGKSTDILRKIMSVHVLLDYYDIEKLKRILPKRSIQVTNLFQSSGLAVNKQGYLNITLSSGQVHVESAAPGSTSDAQLIRSVAAQPYNISVMQISGPIIPSGIENSNAPFNSPTPPPSKAPPPKSKSKSSPSSSPAPSPDDSSDDADTPVADTPASDAPASSSAPSPLADGPKPNADAPGDKDVADQDKDEKKNSACGIRAFGSWIAILALVTWAII